MILRSSFRGIGPTTGASVPTARLQFKSIPEEIAFLRQVIDKYRETPWARETAIAIIRRSCPQKDKLCQALAIAETVQRRIYYVNEYPEVFQSPPRTWAMRAGDCDDQTMVLGALLEAIGIPVEVVGLKMDNEWKHVFLRALVPMPGQGGRETAIPLDTTLSTPVRRLVAPDGLAASRGKKVDTLTFARTRDKGDHMALITGADEDLGFSFSSMAKDLGGQLARTSAGYAANKLTGAAQSGAQMPRPSAGMSPSMKTGLIIGGGLLAAVVVATQVFGRKKATNPGRRRRHRRHRR